MVKEILLQVEIYIYENDITSQINDFIGLTNNYIERIFVRGTIQSKGIGKQYFFRYSFHY